MSAILKRNILVRGIFISAAAAVLLALPCTVSAQKNLASSIVITSTTEDEIVVYGTAMPYHKIDISAKVGGTIESMPFSEGDAVNSGEVVFQIERNDYELQVNLAKTQVERAQVAFEQAKVEFDRAEELFKSNSASGQARDNARFARMAAQANMNSAQASLKIAESTLGNTTAYAPFSGIMSSKYRDAGDFMDKGKPVCELVNIDMIKARLRVPELLISKVKKGDKIDITVDSIDGKVFTGEIYEMKPVGDALTHFFEVTALIKNEDKNLRAGMFLKANIKASK